jgi:hypothetical protein
MVRDPWQAVCSAKDALHLFRFDDGNPARFPARAPE